MHTMQQKTTPSVGCGHPACCQQLFANKIKASPDPAASASQLLLAWVLVACAPLLVFVLAVVLFSVWFNPLFTFLLALVLAGSWYGLLRLVLLHQFGQRQSVSLSK